jgi:hypothetical protein
MRVNFLRKKKKFLREKINFLGRKIYVRPEENKFSQGENLRASKKKFTAIGGKNKDAPRGKPCLLIVHTISRIRRHVKKRDFLVLLFSCLPVL